VPVDSVAPDDGPDDGEGSHMEGGNERVEVQVTVVGSAEKIWELVCDVDLPARYSREFEGGEWLDAPGPGAHFRGHNRIGDFAWSTTCTVVEFLPGEAFTWVVESVDEPVAVWGYTLEDRGNAVDLGMHATLGPALSPPRQMAAADPEHAEEIIARRLRHFSKNMTATVEGIKGLVEG